MTTLSLRILRDFRTNYPNYVGIQKLKFVKTSMLVAQCTCKAIENFTRAPQICNPVVDPLGGENRGQKPKFYYKNLDFFVKSVTFHLILLKYTSKSKHLLPKKQKALTGAQNL